MAAHDQHGRGCDVLPLVTGEVEPHPVGVLAVEGRPHALEVAEWARAEVVALRRDLVQPLPLGELRVAALDHLDAGLLGLLDVASPELVEALVDILERAVRQRHLEHVAGGLHVTESGAAVLALLPAHLPQPVGDLEGARLDVGGLDVAQALHVRVWMPALMAEASQRRMTTGGPIFTEKAPCCLRCASIGWSQSLRLGGAYQLMTGPSGRYAR